jgi:hypothetical protein
MTDEEKRKLFRAEYEAHWKFPARNEQEEVAEWIKLIDQMPEDKIGLIIYRAKQLYDGKSAPRRALFRDILEKIKWEKTTAYLQYRPPGEICGLCGDSGWITYLGDKDGKPDIRVDVGMRWSWALPCRCTLGRAMAEGAGKGLLGYQAEAAAQVTREIPMIAERYPGASGARTEALVARAGEVEIPAGRGVSWTIQELRIESLIHAGAWGPREPGKMARWRASKGLPPDPRLPGHVEPEVLEGAATALIEGVGEKDLEAVLPEAIEPLDGPPMAEEIPF